MTVAERRRRPLSSPVQVGRDDELHLLAGLASNPPSVALVEGQAGVGKTRLVAELVCQRLANTRVLIGHCHRLRDPFPLGPIIDALRGLADLPAGVSFPPVTSSLRFLLPELERVLPGGHGPPGDPGVERHILFRAVVALLGSVGSTVFIVEDLHWSDEETIEFLRYLVDQMPAMLTLIVTYRREDLDAAGLALGAPPPAGVTGARVELTPLGVGDVGSMTKAILGVDELAPELELAVHTRTAGLPFAVEELMRLVADEGLGDDGVVDHGDGLTAAWALEALRAPPAVRDTILERVAGLAPDARAVLDAAAVLDDGATEGLLREVCSLPAAAVGSGLRGALRSSVLIEVEPDGYGFRHPLAAQSVYEAILRPDRRRLHLRAATALASRSPQPVARLAHHYRAAGRTDAWLRWAEATADLAASRDEPATAVRFLTDALTGQPGPRATRGRLAVKLGRAALSGGVTRQRQVVALLRGVVNDDPSGPDTPTVRLFLIALVAWSGDAAGSYDELALCLPEIEGQAGLRVHVMTELAVMAPLGLTAGERLGWLGRAEQLAVGLHDPGADLAVAAARADILVHQGDPTAWDAVARLPTAAASAGDRHRLGWSWLRLAWAALYLGHDGRARAFLDVALSFADGRPQRLTSLGQGVDLVLRRASGDWDGLEAAASAFGRVMQDMANASVAAGQVVGLLALARGDLGLAEALLTECVERGMAAGMARSVAVASASLARIALRRRQVTAARVVAERGVAAVTAGGSWVWAAELVPTAVEALLATASPGEARELATAFATGVTGRDSPLAEAALWECRALLAEFAGDQERAAGAYAEAERRFSAMPRPHEAAMVETRRGRCLLAAGRPEGAAALTAVHDRLLALGAPADAEEVAARLRAHRVTMPSATPAARKALSGTGASLSPREEQVADLAARGLTNTEIGAVLHLSPRTVEAHVAQAVRKLGLSSKRALIGARGQLGSAQNA